MDAVDAAIQQASAELDAARQFEAHVRAEIAADARLPSWSGLSAETRAKLLPSASDAESTNVAPFAGGESVPLGQRAVAVAQAARLLDSARQSAAGLQAGLRSSLAAAALAIEDVSVLHAALCRSERALERVDDVVELRACTSDIASALRVGDAEAAALAIQRFRGVAQTLPVAPDDRQRVSDAERRVVKDTRDALQLAVENGDEAAVSRQCRVLAVLGRGAEGLEIFISHFRARLRAGLPAAALAAIRGGSAGGIGSAGRIGGGDGDGDSGGRGDAEAAAALGRGTSVLSEEKDLIRAWKEWSDSASLGPAVAEAPAVAINVASAVFATAMRAVQAAGSFVAATFDEPSSQTASPDSADAEATTPARADPRGAGRAAGDLWRPLPGRRGEGSRLLAAAAAAEAAAPAALATRLLATSEAVTGLVIGRAGLQSVLKDAASVAGAGLNPCLAFAEAAEAPDAGPMEGGRAGCMWVALGRRLDGLVAGSARSGAQSAGAAAAEGSGIAALGAALDAAVMALQRGTRFRTLLLERAARACDGAGASLGAQGGSAGASPRGARGSRVWALRFVEERCRALVAACDECVAVIVPLEKLQLEVGLARVAALETAAGVSPSSTSLVEDAAWVARQSLGRAASSGDPVVLARVARAVADAWQDGLRNGLRQRARALLGERGQAMPLRVRGSRGSGHSGARAGGAADGALRSPVGAAAAMAAVVSTATGAVASTAKAAAAVSGRAAASAPADDDNDSLVPVAESDADVVSAVRQAAWAMAAAALDAHRGSEGPQGASSAPPADVDPLARVGPEQAAAAATLNAMAAAAAEARAMAAWVREQGSSEPMRLLWEASADAAAEAAGGPLAAGSVPQVEAAALAMEKAASSLAEAGKVALQRLCATLSPALRATTMPLAGSAPLVRYDVDTVGFGDSDEGRPFAQEVIGGLRRIMSPWAVLLSDDVARDCSVVIGGFICKRLLDAVSRRKVSASGALRIEQDAGDLAALLESFGGLKARAKAVRLLQAARLLSSDNLEDAAEEWAVSCSRLTLEEAAALLRLRTDMEGSADSDAVGAALATAEAMVRLARA
ncbi:hypothetical protein FNF28_03365 [Cafeteria roenbergensis]|uniref:Conserved oligomeric Golgi complex subunit 4 N-terminal domain-containing protein n=2 Tax=Cafeteria roenbergensis TaxID=33653 RepID=A0A5A8DL50_CAFRO|nr:hypothetical protein FNF28_03365 [Cafeteria roenbergensis]